MRVVLDTNVVVSALISSAGPAGQVVRLVGREKLIPLYDPRIWAEYEDVLSRPKFCFDHADVQDVLGLIAARGQRVEADPLPSRLPDPDDLPFLEVALSGRARALITGNARHFPRALMGALKVLPPGEFLPWFARK